MGFHDKTRLKLENKKMELAIPLDRVDVYLSFSERIKHLPHVYPKLCKVLSYLALILHSIKSI